MKNLKIYECAISKTCNDILDNESFALCFVTILGILSIMIPFFIDLFIIIGIYSFRKDIIKDIKSCWPTILTLVIFSILSFVSSVLAFMYFPGHGFADLITDTMSLPPYCAMIVFEIILMLIVYAILEAVKYILVTIASHIPECEEEYKNKTGGKDNV